MGKRFRKIRGMIKLAKKLEINVEADDNIIAYQAYRAGTSTVYKTTPQARGSSQPFTLLPFVTADFTSRYASKMSGRAYTDMGKLGATGATLNIEVGTEATATTTTGARIAGFNPAKAIITTLLETPVAKESKITLLTYKRRSGESYTFPFGKKNVHGQRNYPEMTGYLLKELGTGQRTIAFKQEIPQ